MTNKLSENDENKYFQFFENCDSHQNDPYSPDSEYIKNRIDNILTGVNMETKKDIGFHKTLSSLPTVTDSPMENNSPLGREKTPGEIQVEHTQNRIEELLDGGLKNDFQQTEKKCQNILCELRTSIQQDIQQRAFPFHAKKHMHQLNIFIHAFESPYESIQKYFPQYVPKLDEFLQHFTPSILPVILRQLLENVFFDAFMEVTSIPEEIHHDFVLNSKSLEKINPSKNPPHNEVEAWKAIAKQTTHLRIEGIPSDFPTDLFESILSWFEKVKFVSLSDEFLNFPKSLLPTFLKWLKQIKEVSLSPSFLSDVHQNVLSETELEEIGRSLQSVEILHLGGGFPLSYTNKRLEILCRHLSNAHTLYLVKEFSEYTEDQRSILLMHFQRLQHLSLNIGNVNNLSIENIKQLQSLPPNLKYLHIESHYDMAWSGKTRIIINLLNSQPKLSYFGISGNFLDSVSLKERTDFWQAFKNIKHLEFSEVSGFIKNYNFISSSFTTPWSVETLNLNNVILETGSFGIGSWIRKMPHLQDLTLKFRYMRGDTSTIKDLMYALVNIQYLTLIDFNFDHFPRESIPELLAPLKNLKGLILDQKNYQYLQENFPDTYPISTY